MSLQLHLVGRQEFPDTRPITAVSFESCPVVARPEHPLPTRTPTPSSEESWMSLRHGGAAHCKGTARRAHVISFSRLRPPAWPPPPTDSPAPMWPWLATRKAQPGNRSGRPSAPPVNPPTSGSAPALRCEVPEAKNAGSGADRTPAPAVILYGSDREPARCGPYPVGSWAGRLSRRRVRAGRRTTRRLMSPSVPRPSAG